MVTDLEQYERRFRDHFGSPAEVVVRAPGRVEVIGGHTDYNDGWVLPMAIDRECLMLLCRRRDPQVCVFSELFGEECRFELTGALAPGEPAWVNYAKGVAALLLRAGRPLVGVDLYVASDIPLGGGLSSSAALEVGYARCFLAAVDEGFDPIELALLCQEAEHTFAGAPCGIMDQFICVLARSGHALLLDCRSQGYEHIPMPLERAAVMMVDTRVKHDLGRSEYPLRQEQCQAALKVFRQADPKIRALRDVSAEQLEQFADRLDDLSLRRARHVVGENQRVLAAAEAFRKGDLAAAGRIMTASHRSLRDDYEVSCPELDFVVETLLAAPGVYGARMSGGGFGGCAVAIVEQAAADEAAHRVTAAYQNRFHRVPEVFTTRAAGGAEVLRS